jgi:hypothetical protein
MIEIDQLDSVSPSALKLKLRSEATMARTAPRTRRHQPCGYDCQRDEPFPDCP